MKSKRQTCFIHKCSQVHFRTYPSLDWHHRLHSTAKQQLTNTYDAISVADVRECCVGEQGSRLRVRGRECCSCARSICSTPRKTILYYTSVSFNLPSVWVACTEHAISLVSELFVLCVYSNSTEINCNYTWCMYLICFLWSKIIDSRLFRSNVRGSMCSFANKEVRPSNHRKPQAINQHYHNVQCAVQY